MAKKKALPKKAANKKPNKSVLAIAAHPDDIEFMMSGTMALLKQKGWDLHYMNLADGRCGTVGGNVEEIVATRSEEAMQACWILGSHLYPSIAPDMQICHTTEIVSRVVAVVRKAKPSIMLLLAPEDYMEDHTEACRIGVTAAFARGMNNFPCEPPRPEYHGDIALYHCLPVGGKDPMRKAVRAGQYVDVTSVMEDKEQMLIAHESQKEWLKKSQGIDYIDAMKKITRDIGKQSGKFEYAEGWRRRNHLGFAGRDIDPLYDALGKKCIVDKEYEKTLG